MNLITDAEFERRIESLWNIVKDYVSEQIKSELKKPELTVNLEDTLSPSNIQEKQDELWEEKMKPFKTSPLEEKNIQLKDSEIAEETEEVKPYSINITSEPKEESEELSKKEEENKKLEEERRRKEDKELLKKLRVQQRVLSKAFNKELFRLKEIADKGKWTQKDKEDLGKLEEKWAQLEKEKIKINDFSYGIRIYLEPRDSEEDEWEIENNFEKLKEFSRKNNELFNQLLEEINDPNKNTFEDLPLDYKSEEISQLNSERQEILRNRIKERRSTFKFYLDKVFSAEELAEIKEKRKYVYKQEFSEVFDSKKLFSLLSEYTLGIKNKNVNRDIKGFLAGEENINKGTNKPDERIKGYEIDKLGELEIKVAGKNEKWTGENVVKQEKLWAESGERSKQGSLLLPFFLKKENLDPDNLTEENFCKFEWKPGIGNAPPTKKLHLTQGKYAISAGVGKTTKMTSCLQWIVKVKETGGETKLEQQLAKRNIILVTPTKGLSNSARGHHNLDTGFLQKENYECVYHAFKHGKYPMAFNDLTYYKNGKGEIFGEKGVSIMDQYHFLGFMARELLDIEQIDCKNPKEKERVEAGKIFAKTKLLTEDSIIIFDEADYTNSTYNQIVRETVFLEDKNDKNKSAKKVMLMSATFKGKDFSITSSYPIESKEIVLHKDNKQLNIEWLDNLLANSQTLLFLPNTNLSPTQKNILKNVPTVIFNETNTEFSEGISYGVPKGGVMISNSDYRRGFTMKCQVVIDCAYDEIIDIKAPQWTIEKTRQEYSISNLAQGRARCGRREPGIYITISTKTAEPSTTITLLSKMVMAVFGNTGPLSKIYKDFSDPNLIRAALAFPEHFGKEPETVLIGLTIGDPSEKKHYPKWKTAEQLPAGADNILKEKYLGTYEPPTMDEAQAKQTLFLMLNTDLKQQKDFTKNIKAGLESPLIRQANLKKENVNEIQGLINNLVNKKLSKIPSYQENKIEYSSEEEQDFNKVVNLYKVIKDTNIEILKVEKRPHLSVKINYEWD